MQRVEMENIGELICQILDINANVLLGIADDKVVENGNMIMEREIRNNLAFRKMERTLIIK